jgi:hypothetical protein
MRQATGEANMTIIAIVIIGTIAAVGIILIPKLLSGTIYRSCCNQAGGIWQNSYCIAKTPTTCEARENIWKEYDSCVIDNGKHNANEKYRAVECSN